MATVRLALAFYLAGHSRHSSWHRHRFLFNGLAFAGSLAPGGYLVLGFVQRSFRVAHRFVYMIECVQKFLGQAGESPVCYFRMRDGRVEELAPLLLAAAAELSAGSGSIRAAVR